MSHALFPLEGDQPEDNRDISWIHVSRLENGSYEFAPTMWPAGEVEDLSRIHEEFGGGRYELVARSADRRRITARVKVNLPGESKPMVPVSSSKVAALPVPQGPMDPMALMVTMMQQQMAMQMQNSQQMTQVLVAALQGGNKQQDISPLIAAVSSMAQQTSQRGQGNMGPEEIHKWMELGAKIKEGSGGGDDWMGTLGAVLAGMSQMGGGAGGQPPATPTE